MKEEGLEVSARVRSRSEMVLVLQLGAVLMAGFVIAAAWATKPAPAAIARAIGVLAMALGYIAFWGHVWQTGETFWSQHATWKATPRAQAEVAGGRLVLPGVSTDFAEWIRERLKPGDRFYLVPNAAPRNEAVYQWYTFRLLPNLAEREAENRRIG